jgi:hypothetical protein
LGRCTIFGQQRTRAATSSRSPFASYLPVKFVNLAAQAEHVRVVRLHQRALFLVFRFQVRAILPQAVRVLRRICGAGQASLSVCAFRQHPAGCSVGQSLVQGHK